MVHLTIRNDPDEIFLFVDKATAIVSIRFGCTQHNSDRKSTRLNSSHSQISYAVFCLKEHTSELQSQSNLVCRLLLDKKNLRRSVATTSDVRTSSSSNSTNSPVRLSLMMLTPLLVVSL